MAGWDKRFGIRREPGPRREIGLPSARSCRYVPPAFRNMHATKAPVAQLDRAPDYESGGWEFESLRARQHTLEHAGSSRDARFCDSAPTYPAAARLRF